MIYKKSFNKPLRIKSEFINRLLVMVLLCLHPALLWAQIADERIDQILYVNQEHHEASDHNPGTQALPFKTITKAAAVTIAHNKNNVGTKILIEAGTYRESISLPTNGHETDAPIIFEAKGKVIISGSDVWTGWQLEGSSNVYTHPWPYTWGLAPIPDGWEPQVTVKDIIRRREMVFVGETALDQMLSYSELQSGSFYVDESAGTIYIHPPEGINLDNALVEVSVRSGIFSVSGKTNMVLRGIIFQHDNTPLDERAVRFYDSTNILVENCQFRWNNWGGLGFGRSRNVTARKNVINHNGGAGMTTWKTNTAVFEENETSHNNWRGVKGGFTGWAVAGMKNLHMHGGIFLRHKSVGNATHGIWYDTDCENILINEALFCDNLRYGIYLEANQGPITIQNSVVCRNRHYGMLIANSAGVILERNIIYGNSNRQIMVSGIYDSERTATNWETGEKMPLLAGDGTWIYNAIVGTDASQLLVGTTLSPHLWNHFLDTLTSNRNLWFNSQNTSAFQLAGGNQVDISAWQSATGQDNLSLFADPLFKDPANDDFTPLPGSPLLGIPGWQTSLSPPKNLRIIL